MKTIDAFVESMNKALTFARAYFGNNPGSEHLIEANRLLAEQVVSLEMRVAALIAMADEIRKNAELVTEQVKTNANAVILSHATIPPGRKAS